MRRLVALSCAGVLALVITLPASARAAGAIVVHEDLWCSVAWKDDLSVGARCDVQNVLMANGIFIQVLHGQIPVSDLETFKDDGSPSSFATPCLVNYGWRQVYGDSNSPRVFTQSVRHFTPDGRMTQVCAPSIPSNIVAQP
jgi:hypothetical protein